MTLLPADGLTALVALIAPGVITPDGVTLGEAVIEALPTAGEDVPLPGIDRLELIDDVRADVDALCVNSSEMPLLPSTDPVWTLTIGLHGLDVVVVRPGG